MNKPTKRNVIIHKDSRGYGMSISGDNPVYIQRVNPGMCFLCICLIRIFWSDFGLIRILISLIRILASLIRIQG